MSFVLLSFVFILFSCRMPLSTETAEYTINIIPTFVGYLILWFHLEKRQINRRVKAAYTVSTILLVIFFLEAVAEIRFFFEGWLQGDGLFIGLILNLFAAIFEQGTYLTQAIGALFALLFLWGLEKARTEKEQSLFPPRLGMIFCGLLAIYSILHQFLLFPIPFWAVSVPAGVVILICIGISLRNIPEME